MPGPLAGVKIVDLSSMLSGPWATTIMADQGADVIKVEPLGKGDHVRSLGNQRGGMSSMFLNINRNKRSITVNLKQPDGVRIVHDLAKDADIVVQNFRPGVVERLGVAYEDLREVNPEIIYLSLSGFGETGPWRDKPVYDPVIQAVSGLTTIQAGSDSQRPRLVRTVLPDKFSAMAACQAATAALVHKGRSGRGQHVRLSMLDAVLSFLWASDFGAQTYPDLDVSDHSAASFVDLIYETADGHMTVSTMSNKEWSAFCTAMARPELAEDPRFATPALRDRNVDDRLRVIQDCLKPRSTDENLALLESHGVPCAPTLTRSQVVDHPQVVNNRVLFESDHPTAGRLRQARNAARFEGSPTAHRKGAPELGEDTFEIMAEIGRSPSEIGALLEAGIIGAEKDRRNRAAAE